VGGRGSSPVKEEERRARSPGKEVRGRSPEKQLITANLSPARSESQIASAVEKKRESRSLEHLNTAVENRAKEEERRREEERRNNEENERRRKEEERRRAGVEEERRRVEEERRKLEERKMKEERRKSGARQEGRDSREKSPSKQVKSNDSKEEKRRDSRGDPGRGESRGERKRGAEEQRRPSVHTSTINPLLSELARKHGAGGGRHTDAVEELKNAFELAERSSPGITNRLVEQVLSRLQPGLSEARLASALENLGR